MIGRLVFAGLAAVSLCSAAIAQAPQRWTDPTGAWSLEYVSVGWGTADGLPQGGPTTLMTTPMKEPGEGEVRICLVEQTVSKALAAKDATRFAQGVSTDVLQKAFPQLEFDNTKVSHIDVDGVAVVDLVGKSGKNRMRARYFFTPYKEGSVQTKVKCILNANLRPELAAEVDAILGSVRFNTTANPAPAAAPN